MDVASWYAVTLGGLMLASVLASVLFSIIAISQHYGGITFRRYLLYPQIPRYLRNSDKTSWFDLLVFVMFLGANAIALSAGVGSTTHFIRRSGLISVINLIPLFLGGQMNIIASRCGIGLRAYIRIHRWLGAVAIAEGLLHAIMSMARQMPNLKLRTDVAGLVVGISADLWQID